MPLGWNFGRLLSSLTDTVTQDGRSLVAWYVRPGLRLRDVLRDIAPRAILEIVPLPEQDREAAAAANVPIISASAPLGGMDRAVGALQVRHLAESGHRRLGIVTVDDQSVAVFGDPRRQGVRMTTAAMGLLPPVELVLDTRETGAAMGIKLPFEAGRGGHGGHGGAAVRQIAETLHDWTAGPDPVTAVCCFNDLFAALVIAAARTIGLAVPDHLSVIGVDDEPMGGFLQPTLTTVRFDFEGTTAHTQALLRATLDGKPMPAPPGGEFVELVERESVARLTAEATA
jgi:DNA-binding LacI/PurR family transcriptional regulator